MVTNERAGGATPAQFNNNRDGITVVKGHSSTPGATCQYLRVPVALFARATDTTPVERVVEWPQLVEVLTRHDIRHSKDGKLWSPVAYGANKTRRAANVAAVSCLVLDIDTLVAPALLAKRWEEMGLEFVIHSTHSSTLEAPKWRAVFPLARPVPASEWKDTLRKLTLHLAGGNADPSCKDVSRMFYLPSCPPEHVSARIARHHEGRPLDPDEVPEPAPELIEKAEGERRRAVLPAGSRGDYRTLDVVALFEGHGLYGRELAPGKHAVLCPWVHEHTEQRDASYGDTVIWEAADGAWPTFFCSHSHCAGRGMADVIAKLGDADRYCAQEFTPKPRPGVPASALDRIATCVTRAQEARKAGERPDAAEAFDLARDLAGLAEADPVAYGKARAQLKAAFGDLLSLRDLDRAILAARPAASRPKASPNDKARPLSDYGNAERLVDRHGADLRYCESWNKWLVWDGSRWDVDRTGEVMRRAKDTVRALYKEAAEIADDNLRQAYLKHIAKSENAKALQNMITLAQSEPGIPILPEELDTHPWLLACENGTLDLTTGELRPHRREDLITRRVPVIFDPDATCPTVERFVSDIFGGDPEMVDYIWRALGYAITGSVKERVLFILWGAKGNNGKTTLLELLADVLCDYAAKVKAETLMVKHGDSIPNDLARLKGARFVFASEGEENRRLAEALVKEITGGDTITARFMRGEWFDFRPEFKVFFATNHRPVIRGTDPAIWQRIHLIPFTERFVEDPGPGEHTIDKDLPAKLRAELPGFLAKIVRGCLEWQRIGLKPPKRVQAATEAYRGDMDIMADWIAECCVVTPHAQSTPSALYTSYAKWCEAAGEHPCSMKSFSMRLQERGFEATRTSRQRFFKGIGLLASDFGDGSGVVTGDDGRSGINTYNVNIRDYTGKPVTTRHPIQPVTQDPVDDEEIGTCACGRPGDRFTAIGEPICSECAGERGAE